MVDETRLDELYDVYTRLETIADDVTSKDIKNELIGLADLYREEYEELDDEWHKQLRAEEKQANREFNSGRI